MPVRNGVESAPRADGTERFRARRKIHGKVIVGRWRRSHDQARADWQAMGSVVAAPTGQITFGDAIRMAAADLKRREVRPRTMRRHLSRWRMMFEHWPDTLSLRQIDREAIQKYVDAEKDRGIRPQSIAISLASLRLCFRAARLAGGYVGDPFEGVELGRPRIKPIKWFAQAELTALLKRIRSWSWDFTQPAHGDARQVADIMELYACSGLRREEGTSLLMRHIQRGRSRIFVENAKTGDRYVRLHSRLAELVDQLAEDPDNPEAFVLPIRYHSVGAMFTAWAERLEEPRLTCHAMRHTFGTALAATMTPADPMKIKQAMGHASITMSLRYIHAVGRGLDDDLEAISFHAPD